MPNTPDYEKNLKKLQKKFPDGVDPSLVSEHSIGRSRGYGEKEVREVRIDDLPVGLYGVPSEEDLDPGETIEELRESNFAYFLQHSLGDLIIKDPIAPSTRELDGLVDTVSDSAPVERLGSDLPSYWSDAKKGRYILGERPGEFNDSAEITSEDFSNVAKVLEKSGLGVASDVNKYSQRVDLNLKPAGDVAAFGNYSAKSAFEVLTETFGESEKVLKVLSEYIVPDSGDAPKSGQLDLL